MPEISAVPLLPLRFSSSPSPSKSSEGSECLQAVMPHSQQLIIHQNSSSNLFIVDNVPASKESQGVNICRDTSQTLSKFNHSNPTLETSPGQLRPSSRPQSPQVQHPKGDAQPLVHELNPEFVTQMKTNFRNMMTGLQGFPGEVTVQAEFGRIILRKVNPMLNSQQNTTEGLLPNEMLSNLTPNTDIPNNQTQIFFTNILTTLPTDANYLLSLKSQTGQPLWEENAKETSVIYEISCHNEAQSGWNPFSIEIDRETFVANIKTRYDFGAINVHGVLRHWDFRLAAFGFGDEGNEEQYGEFASAIQRSLYIPYVYNNWSGYDY